MFNKEHVIFNPAENTINGVPVQELEDRLERSVPPGYVALCHICEIFLTKEEDKDHDLKVHRIKR